MQITVLDGYTLNPGDLSWEGLQALGTLHVYERTSPELIVERAKEADIVLTNKTPLTSATIALLPKLKYIGVLATGYDVVDVEAASARNIPVSNVPTYGTDSVAQFVMALLLELCHRIGSHSQSVHRGEWSEGNDFCYWHYPLTELAGKTMGIIGLGRIGLRTAELAAAFGMKVKGYARTPKPNLHSIEQCGLDELLRTSDVVSLHCPLTEETAGMMHRGNLAKMKNHALLINTARGKLVIEADLAAALREGVIAGAALDVLESEPPKSGSPLFGLDNCIITPHIAWASREARTRLLHTAVENVSRFMKGEPFHAVNRA
ncbi:D-2-hydroxyacid dehydrogenase [Xylanibacillus composti]|uniref:Glycerate dehydrogenase n=1 Tax=Xylanibacillus composti TaxID=1572762 RepID=A0A8J4H5I8_9BACL|nr:D-2-hydroxyacid dehydrogenase [Xylanibacillus composti]MDT9727106.1 D-2-hydroxyacid dehydrogenase [Xylanibacillus composti]GIQ68883.1 glycerate dehydrogenase [Xylanibacillus composti]